MPTSSHSDSKQPTQVTKKLHMHVYYNEGNDIKSISIS